MFGIRISGLNPAKQNLFKPIFVKELNGAYNKANKIYWPKKNFVEEQSIVMSFLDTDEKEEKVIHVEFLGFSSHLKDDGKKFPEIATARIALGTAKQLCPELKTFIWSFNEQILFSCSTH